MFATLMLKVIRAQGPTERISRANRVGLEKGDLLRLVTASGGGWEPAKARSLEAIQDDVKNNTSRSNKPGATIPSRFHLHS
ncbi:hypothetical protein D3C87_1197480 [compost metagenome]|uniref:hypothetical protein n=1 Tax=Pseudomonas sp. ACN5 TaxID=1920427 RepID=UPI000FB49C64|nr:hypothetical protein [Pseudomonas sp. ACN5]PBJ04835.1 hypothetical protein BSF40_36360 [Pseudomonas sp. ACN5]